MSGIGSKASGTEFALWGSGFGGFGGVWGVEGL